jgi:hypothetical protein
VIPSPSLFPDISPLLSASKGEGAKEKKGKWKKEERR